MRRMCSFRLRRESLITWLMLNSQICGRDSRARQHREYRRKLKTRLFFFLQFFFLIVISQVHTVNEKAEHTIPLYI